MVIQIRVDDRLLHGQVAIVWSQELSTKGIIVANDRAAQSEALSGTLKMSCPSSQRLLVKTMEDAARVINDPRGAQMRILVLVNCVKDALTLVKACPGQIPAVNMANVGRFDGSDPEEQLNLTKTIRLNPSELEATRELISTGVEVFSHVVPADPKVSIADELAKVG